MAEYLVLIYGDEKAIGEAGPALWEQLSKEHMAFGQTHEKAILGGRKLHDAASATTIRRESDGSQTTTDGPFPETKEVLGGYYLIEAPDLDAALAIARDVPTPFGAVEVRPIDTMEG
jgi:hypothetical protein